MNKSELRKIYLQKRRELDPKDFALKTNDITSAFSALDLSSVYYLHLFYPIIGKAELSTLKIAAFVRLEYPQINLVLSKSNFTDHSLNHIIWTEDTPLAVNNYGITEPESGVEVHPKQIDLVLIPLLVFDLQGYRVGYGKGFYDRFLSQCRPDTKKIGLSFFDPINQIKDIDPYDVKMDLCITPEKIWDFKAGNYSGLKSSSTKTGQ